MSVLVFDVDLFVAGAREGCCTDKEGWPEPGCTFHEGYAEGVAQAWAGIDALVNGPGSA